MKQPGRPVSMAEAEKADFVVCMRVVDGNAFSFRDNQFGRCRDCQAAIYFRPDNPRTPPKICIGCAMTRAGVSEEDRARAWKEYEKEFNRG